MNAVARHERDQRRFHRAGQRLESLVGRHAGARVEERREVVAERRLVQDDVVLLAAVDLVQAELRLRPVNAVAAFAVAGDFRLRRRRTSRRVRRGCRAGTDRRP